MNSTVSILIPTYNRLDALIDALDSVYEQTILPNEIIIGDDSTNDLTEKYIENLQQTSKIPIYYFHNKPSLKQMRNVDSLFKKAKSDYIMLLHDDDMLLPKCIELLKKPLDEIPEVIASFGNQILTTDGGEVIEGSEKINSAFFRTPERSGIVDGFMAGAVSMFPNDCYLVRRDDALAVGYLDNEGRAGNGIDFYFGYSLGKLRKPFYYVNELTAKYRLSNESIRITSDSGYTSVKILFEDCKDSMSPEIEQSIKNKIANAITIAVRKKDKKNASKWLFSKYYRNKLVTPRGIKRLLLVVNPF
ncbi:glycosyltransferase family 2 protein [Flavobacterium sp.]|uniref:glycosyltransferase family 2 protein n=1 Tax=Flavobacterium sp. TaxID=239 RepID=UPI002C5CAF31|nr:glycosyltransferase family 2 protein [Flavobacterium sp.]HSD06041.1 glycosyltransferase family 2 protein [Flavobacterium sp.]